MTTKQSENEITEKIKDSCFIITPIGSAESETFKKTNGLIASIIDPVLKTFDFKAVPAYEIPNSGSINRQILKSILNDKLVIANLTGLNPNVMYELAVRHAVRLPVIIMAEHGTNLPFDITDQRTIFYHDTLLGAEEAKPKLTNAIQAALDDSNIDNPIYQVIEEGSIIKASHEKEQSFNEYLIKRIDQLENNITSIKKKTFNSDAIFDTGSVGNKLKSIEVEFLNKSLTNGQMNEIIKKAVGANFSSYTMHYPGSGRVRIFDIKSDKDSLASTIVTIFQKQQDFVVKDFEIIS